MDVNSAVQKAYNKDQEVSELKKKVDSAYSTWQTAQTAADQSQAAYNAKATANAQNKSDVDSTNAAALAKAQAALSDFESNDEKMKAAQDYSEYLTAIAAGMPYAKPTEAESAYLEYQQLKADVAAASSAASTTASDDELKEIDVQNTQNQTAATNAKTEYDNLKSQYDTAVADADTLKTGLTTAERAQLTQLESAADEAVTQYETGQAAADKVATQKVTSQTNTLDSEEAIRADQATLENREVKADIDGIVTAVNVADGPEPRWRQQHPPPDRIPWRVPSASRHRHRHGIRRLRQRPQRRRPPVLRIRHLQHHLPLPPELRNRARSLTMCRSISDRMPGFASA